MTTFTQRGGIEHRLDYCRKGVLTEFLVGRLPAHPMVVEVGVFKGGYSKELHARLSPALLTLVDPWKVFPDSVYGDYRHFDQAKWDALAEGVMRRFSYSSVNILRGESSVMCDCVPNESVDLVYIDGNHSYDAVVEDLSCWYCKLRVGGFMAGHDYGEAPVQRGVADFLKDLQISEMWVTNEKNNSFLWCKHK